MAFYLAIDILAFLIPENRPVFSDPLQMALAVHHSTAALTVPLHGFLRYGIHVPGVAPHLRIQRPARLPVLGHRIQLRAGPRTARGPDGGRSRHAPHRRYWRGRLGQRASGRVGLKRIEPCASARTESAHRTAQADNATAAMARINPPAVPAPPHFPRVCVQRLVNTTASLRRGRRAGHQIQFRQARRG